MTDPICLYCKQPVKVSGSGRKPRVTCGGPVCRKKHKAKISVAWMARFPERRAEHIKRYLERQYEKKHGKEKQLAAVKVD